MLLGHARTANTQIRRHIHREAAMTVASDGNAYGIEQNCVYGPLQKHLPWPEKVTMIKNQQITPSVSTETCDENESAQRYFVWFPTFWVLRQLLYDVV